MSELLRSVQASINAAAHSASMFFAQMADSVRQFTARHHHSSLRSTSVPPTMKTAFMGADPGASGGVALLRGDNVLLFKMPDSEIGLWRMMVTLVEESLARGFNVVALVEKVGGYIPTRPGTKGGIGGGQPGSAMFKFGAAYGMLRMALTAVQIKWADIAPATWQRQIGIDPRGKKEAKHVWKGRLKTKAQELFPSSKVILATADALLLAECCRRVDSTVWQGKHKP